MSNDREYAYMLHNISGIGNKTLFRLHEEFGDARSIYRADDKYLRKLLTQKQMELFSKAKASWDVQKEYEDLYRRGIDFYYYFANDYPAKLKDIPDPPYGLYCIGRLPYEDNPAVSIIGARNSSEYGKYVAKQFGKNLAEHNVQIISGMARGVDGIGQQAAIDAGGTSFGVLGSGVDICYPSENRGLYEALITNGGIISEYAPGTQPKPQFFPPRNRIISGLSDAVLVVEARQKSGTLITVDMALEQGREVFAVPGRICDSLSGGCNSLIRQGAEIVTSAEDIIEYLRRNHLYVPCGENGNMTSSSEDCMDELTEMQRKIAQVMDFYPQTPSTIHDKLIENGINAEISAVMNGLVELCIMGLVAQSGGGFHKKI